MFVLNYGKASSIFTEDSVEGNVIVNFLVLENKPDTSSRLLTTDESEIISKDLQSKINSLILNKKCQIEDRFKKIKFGNEEIILDFSISDHKRAFLSIKTYNILFDHFNNHKYDLFLEHHEKESFTFSGC